MNAAIREAANQARQKPVKLTHNQEVSSMPFLFVEVFLRQWVLRTNMSFIDCGIPLTFAWMTSRLRDAKSIADSVFTHAQFFFNMFSIDFLFDLYAVASYPLRSSPYRPLRK
jgi:hypothetical protein